VKAWAGLGNEGWDWDEFSKAVKRSVSIPGDTDTNGPVKLWVPDLDEPEKAWFKVWTETIKTVGYPQCDPFSGEVLGSLITPEIIDPATGRRCSSDTAYLKPALGRSNLTVITGATATRVLFDEASDPNNVEAKGVEYAIKQDDGSTKTLTIVARKEIILAAGTINSPRLLELSGIGDASRLKSLDVKVVVDNPHVGENLQNHILVGTNFEVKEESDMPSSSPFARQEPAIVQAAKEAFARGYVHSSSSILEVSSTLFPGFNTFQHRAFGHDRQQRVRSNPLSQHRNGQRAGRARGAHSARCLEQ
jgi:choline dehydrogenase-like flavoprotein